MDKITDPEMKLFLYKYQKDLKTRILGERGDKLKIKEDVQKEKTEEEVREDGASSAVAYPKDKGKCVLQGSSTFYVDTMENTLQKGLEQALTKVGCERDELVK